MSYWDTSALAKLYLPELDSPVFEQKAAGAAPCQIARLAIYEMRRVAFRKESEGLIQSGTAETILNELEQDIAAGDIQVVELDTALESEFKTVMATCYRNSPPLLVRTFDAIHVAAARTAGETEVVATDKRLRVAAKLVGLSLFPV